MHDEVVIDTVRSEARQVSELVRSCMEGAASLAVALEVEVGTGDNWLDAH
ncbi:MAG: hypothetical protein LBU97_02385 [Alistipes sp.]|nr:hypothetical protein [Alistipes sp.]